MSTSTASEKSILKWIQNKPLLMQSNSKEKHPDVKKQLDNVNSLASNGVFLGNDESNLNNGSHKDGVEIFSNPKNLPTAISSILNEIQKRAAFFPSSSPDLEEAVIGFKDYLEGIDSSPVFSFSDRRVDAQKFESGDYNKFIDSIVSVYDGISAEDLNKLKDGIVGMAKSLFGDSTGTSSKEFFTQSVINTTKYKKPKILLTYMRLFMSYKEDGKKECKEQEYKVYHIQHEVLSHVIHDYADQLAKFQMTSIKDWVNGITTPVPKNAKKLCFESKRKKK